jgi:hypothetical protein
MVSVDGEDKIQVGDSFYFVQFSFEDIHLSTITDEHWENKN